MRKWLIGLGVLLVGVVGVAWYYQDFLRFMYTASVVTPSGAFDTSKAPQAPNYSSPTSWAALPDRKDDADVLPAGETDVQADAPVDVFFLHPTTFLSADNWNQPLDHAETNKRTDEFVLRGQASAFNGCCKVYAPRYRQATFASFLDNKGNGAKAIDLAYADVEAAFDHFITHFNNGRPFIIAGHSQGSRHAFRLMERRITGTPLAARLVAAYPIGIGMNKSDFAKSAPDLPLCTSATETGCVVTWNAVAPQAPVWMDPKDHICINPLTWKAGAGLGVFDLNVGSLSLADGNIRIVEKAADADCVDGRLIVSELHTDAYDNRPMILGKYNYHILDYALFYMNLRRNARDRVEAFLAKPQPQTQAQSGEPG